MSYKIKTGKELVVGDTILFNYPNGYNLIINQSSHKILKIRTLPGGNLSMWLYDDDQDTMEKLAIGPDTLVMVA